MIMLLLLLFNELYMLFNLIIYKAVVSGDMCAMEMVAHFQLPGCTTSVRIGIIYYLLRNCETPAP